MKRGNIYIALSHCWGTDQGQLPLRTTRDKLKDYKQHIENAVTVAREIDVEYLWIHSLLETGRKKESQKMEQVFSSAYCTISATSVKNSHEGFLTFPAKEAARIPDEENSQFAVYTCIASKSFKQAVGEYGLLNTCGWVLQERALSRRTIHFTGSQIFWECGPVIFAMIISLS
ncbi:hypothetical protein V8E54_013741 [Elaphomyces granulatus]